MNVSPIEAEEALVTIQTMMKKTRRAISASGAYGFLIVWGFAWLFGFLGSQFLPEHPAGYLWAGLDSLAAIFSAILGIRMGTRVRSPSTASSGRRIGIFWFLLFLYIVASIGVVWPVDGRQLAMIIILFVMVGWVGLSLLLSFISTWPALIITVLALIGFFLLPDIFYLWMAVLGGGGMIALGLYIRARW
jgi:hypothetical protein